MDKQKQRSKNTTEESTLTAALSSNTRNPKLDRAAKTLLADKQVLARILKRVTVEFSDEDLDSIMDAIEGKPQIEVVPVTPGQTNLPPEATRLVGDETQSNISNEGMYNFDIKFSVRLPEDKFLDFGIRIIVDLEAQGKYSPGYDLISRGIFYGSRLISSQSGTEFIGDDYGNLRKVYSIWICTAPPAYAANSIVRFRIQPEILYGEIPPEKIQKMKYDLMDVVLVAISTESSDDKDELCGMLEVLLDERADSESKLKRLVSDYGMKRTYTLTKEVTDMGSYSEGIAQKNYDKGHTAGYDKGHSIGYGEGRSAGYGEGCETEQLLIAKNLLRQNLSDEFILKAGITPENLAKAKEQLLAETE